MKDMRIERILFSESEIRGIVSELADKIKDEYKSSDSLIVLCVLKGASIFTSDLVRRLDELDVRLGFIKASSYGGNLKSSGVVKLSSFDGLDGELDIKGKDVLVTEDIVDTGHTLKALKHELLKLNPKSVKVCAMFDKPSRREVDFEADFVGRRIPDVFIVGYGLDYDERFRNLPYAAALCEA